MVVYLVSLVVMIAAGTGGVLAWTRRRARRLAAATKLAIGSVTDATRVEVRGLVACDEPLIAPFTRRACVYVRLEMYCETMGRVYHHVWSARRDFSISDASGRAVVLVEQAHFEVIADIVQIGRVMDLTSEQQARLRELQWKVPPIGPVELREAIVEVGATIDVAGMAVREPDRSPPQGERGYRDGPPMVAVFQGAVVIADGRRERTWIGDAPAR